MTDTLHLYHTSSRVKEHSSGGIAHWWGEEGSRATHTPYSLVTSPEATLAPHQRTITRVPSDSSCPLSFPPLVQSQSSIHAHCLLHPQPCRPCWRFHAGALCSYSQTLVYFFLYS